MNTTDQLTKQRKRAERDAAAAAAHPLDSLVTTTVHSIGGRSERVSGQVVDHRRGDLIVKTEAHGRIVVPLDSVHN